MKKIILCLLIASMLLALTACGGGKSIVGTWEGQIDIAKNLSEQVDASLGSSIHFSDYLNKLPMTITVEYTQDGNYSMRLSCDDSARQTFADAYVGFLRAYFNDYVGRELTDEEIESALGTTLEAFAKDAADSTIDAMIQAGQSSGTYTVKGNTITYGDGGVDTFTLSGDTLTVPVTDFGDVVFTRK